MRVCRTRGGCVGAAPSGQRRRRTLLDGLGRLEPKDRAVLVLRYWEDRSVDDTAAELGLSAGAVRSRSFRAMEGSASSSLIAAAIADDATTR